jgi:hypothetical protein
MTPQKEKAIEIVDKYFSICEIEYPMGINDDLAKQCTKIAVNEIIKAKPIIPYKYVSENDAMNEANEFWSEVLKEIDKL